MDYGGFINTVEDVGEIPAGEAERAACATLKTLSERISTGQTEDLAARLPRELQACLEPDDGREPFHVDEFLRRITVRAGVVPEAAERDARAVLSALSAAVGPDEFADMRAELPEDFDPLLDEALRAAPRVIPGAPPPPGALSVRCWLALAFFPPGQMVETTPPEPVHPRLDDRLARVGERARLDAEGVQRAVDAVLEALASRITCGEIDDIEFFLPPALRPALERGRARSGGRARPLSIEAFLATVARLEDADRGTASEHTRAVLRTLREAIGDKEFHDIASQLPDEYRTLCRAA